MKSPAFLYPRLSHPFDILATMSELSSDTSMGPWRGEERGWAAGDLWPSVALLGLFEEVNIGRIIL